MYILREDPKDGNKWEACTIRVLARPRVMLLWLCMANNPSEKVTEPEQGLTFKS